MKIELSILLGINCNFRCTHCINDSKPGNTLLDLSQFEIDKIVDEVILNTSITRLSFIGGEPLLYLNQITQILSNIRKKAANRKFHISITTNGSLISKYSKELRELKINDAILSYDEYHQPFLKQDKFEMLVVESKGIFSNVFITYTFYENLNISLIQNICTTHDIKVIFNQAIEGGRFKKSNNDKIVSLKPIVCLVDSFNKPSQSILNNFNVKCLGMRLNLRSV